MKNKLVQNSLFVGITVALFVGVIFVSNANFALSQNVTGGISTDIGVTSNDTSALNSSNLDNKGNWSDKNSTLNITS